MKKITILVWALEPAGPESRATTSSSPPPERLGDVRGLAYFRGPRVGSPKREIESGAGEGCGDPRNRASGSVRALGPGPLSKKRDTLEG